MRIIAGKYRGKKLFSPQSDGVRPTADRARESVFNILNSRLKLPWENYQLLDLFSGTGAFALEALSRGASLIAMVDHNPQTVRKNAALFPNESQQIRIITADATKLPPAQGKYNLLFADAPYNRNLSTPALISAANQNWLSTGAICIVETEKSESLTIPQGFELQDERCYGIAKFSFLIYRP